jgi:hypothetical protein
MLGRVTKGAGMGRDEDAPARSLDVAPTPVRDARGGRRRGAIVLAVVGAAIAAAVGSAQLGDVGVAHVAEVDHDVVGVAPSGNASASLAALLASPAIGPAAAIVDATPVRLRPAEVATRVRDGSLDGRLVFVDGVLQVTPVGCRSLATVGHGCVDLAIPGIGVPIRAAQASLAGVAAPPLGAWIVTVARAGSLVYLGSLVPEEDVPAGIPELERQLLDSARDTADGTLFQADTTLVTRVASGCTDVCPPPPPYLADAPATGDPARPEAGTAVEIAIDAPEIPADAGRVDGTFLLARTGNGTQWRVVARYVPSRAVRVLVP